jgi:hypothetical protein
MCFSLRAAHTREGAWEGPHSASCSMRSHPEGGLDVDNGGSLDASSRSMYCVALNKVVQSALYVPRGWSREQPKGSNKAKHLNAPATQKALDHTDGTGGAILGLSPVHSPKRST